MKKTLLTFGILALFILGATIQPAQAADTYDFSDYEDNDFTMGNTYNENVSFQSVAFNPNQSFLEDKRSKGYLEYSESTNRKMRVDNTWFNYVFHSNEIELYRTDDLFAHVSDGQQLNRYYELNQTLDDSDYAYPITYYENGTYYLFITNTDSSEIELFYGSTATDLNTNITINETKEDWERFGEVYKYNETTYFTMLYEFDESYELYAHNLTIMTSTNLTGWTYTDIRFNQGPIEENDLLDYAFYKYDSKYYFYINVYNYTADENQHIYYETYDPFNMTNYTEIYREVNDIPSGIRYYPVGHSIVKTYFNTTDNKLTIETARDKYEILTGGNAIYKFYWNGIYEYSGAPTGDNLTEYITAHCSLGSYYNSIDYLNKYGLNLFALGNLKYINFTSFNPESPTVFRLRAYSPDDNDLGQNDATITMYINISKTEFPYSDYYLLENLGNSYIDYVVAESYTYGSLDLKGFSFSFDTDTNKREDMQITLYHDPADISEPWWYILAQLSRTPQETIALLGLIVGSFLILLPNLPKRFGAIIIAISFMVYFGGGLLGFLI